MALNLGPNRQTVNNGALNLSRTGAPAAGSYPMGAGPAPNAIMDGLYAGAGVDPRYFQQPVAPPSEIEIQMALLRSLAPIDRFIKSPEMGILIELLSNVVTFSVMEILRNATFKLDEDGNMQMDVTSLPTHLQTISGENVAADFTTLQSHAQQAVAEAEAQQAQIVALADQSMLGGALATAMADEGLMTRMGNTAGSVIRGVITGGR
jgi:hypothetical protein